MNIPRYDLRTLPADLYPIIFQYSTLKSVGCLRRVSRILKQRVDSLECFWEKAWKQENKDFEIKKRMSWQEHLRNQQIHKSNLRIRNFDKKEIKLPPNIEWRITDVQFLNNKFFIVKNDVDNDENLTHSLSIYNQEGVHETTISEYPVEAIPDLIDWIKKGVLHAHLQNRFTEINVFSLDEHRFYTTGAGHCAVWDFSGNCLFARFNIFHALIIQNNQVIYSNEYDQIEIWDLATKQCRTLKCAPNISRLLLHGDVLIGIARSDPDERKNILLAIDINTDRILYWEEKGQVWYDRILIRFNFIIAWSITYNSFLDLYDINTGSKLKRLDVKDRDITSWSCDSKYLYYVVTKDSARIEILDLESGENSFLNTVHPVSDIMLESNRLIAFTRSPPVTPFIEHLYIWKTDTRELLKTAKINENCSFLRTSKIFGTFLCIEFDEIVLCPNGTREHVQFWDIAAGEKIDEIHFPYVAGDTIGYFTSFDGGVIHATKNKKRKLEYLTVYNYRDKDLRKSNILLNSISSLFTKIFA